MLNVMLQEVGRRRLHVLYLVSTGVASQAAHPEPCFELLYCFLQGQSFIMT